jgi:hypothetical protein
MSLKLDGLNQEPLPPFEWMKMPYHSVMTWIDFLDAARQNGVFEGDTKKTLKQISEGQAHYFDRWVWAGCRRSRKMAEYYELLELELRGNKEAWAKLHKLFNKQDGARKGNHVIVKKEIIDALDTIIEKNESSVNTKSISGDTDDDAASLTSESIHKRLDHSDK